MRFLIVLAVSIAAVCANEAGYDGYKVYRIQPSSEEQLHYLANLSRNNSNLDFWSYARQVGDDAKVMVNPEDQNDVVEFLKQTQIKHEVLIDDVEGMVKKERMAKLRAPRAAKGKIDFHNYYTHEEINAYLDELVRSFPPIVTVETIGKSHEGREIKVIKISSDASGSKPIIFVDAGIHAREWIAPAQALYIINQLVENPANSALLKKFDWHILPVVNPDGYEHTHTDKRMWRKTRSPNSDPDCPGTDANRNFAFHWGESGTSDRECDVTYKGKNAFSETEAMALGIYVHKIRQHVKLYLTLHSHGKYILYPWGYTATPIADEGKLKLLAHYAGRDIYDVKGTIYKVGSAGGALYPAAGGSDDWMKGVAGIPYSYTIELPGGGSQGFDLPPEEILPVVQETWVGIKAFHRELQKEFAPN